MKKVFFAAVVIVIACICLFGFSGCVDAREEPEHSVSIVMAVRDNFPKIQYNNESLYETIYDAAYSWGYISAVVADGDPSVMGNWKINNPNKGINDAKRRQLATNCTETIISNLMTFSPDDTEGDTLRAIKISADALNSTDSDIKTLVVYDSGLGTAGVLNFAAKNILGVPAETVVKQLEEDFAIPDLSGIDVVWTGIGQVAGEQETLASSYEHKLEMLWAEILKAAGAKSVNFDRTPLPAVENEGDMPFCSVVPVVADTLDVDVAESVPDVVKFDENSSVKFKSNKAEFVDEKAAEKELLPIAEYLLAYPDESFYILGMTATVPGGDGGKQLSLKRAEACKELLVKNGVEADRLVCVGLGHTDHPLRADDTDNNGNLIEDAARVNRAVIFATENSELVDTLIVPFIEGSI